MPLNEKELMLERLANGLETTSKLVQGLLREIKDGEKDLVSIKTELVILRDNVKALSKIVREGNGEMSLLTKVAIFDQRLQDILKWLDNHAAAHNQLNSLVSKSEDIIADLERRLAAVESDVGKLNYQAQEKQRAQMDSLIKENELRHHKELSKTDVSKEKQKAIIKIVVAIILAVITFIFGYFMKGAGDGPKLLPSVQNSSQSSSNISEAFSATLFKS